MRDTQNQLYTNKFFDKTTPPWKESYLVHIKGKQNKLCGLNNTWEYIHSLTVSQRSFTCTFQALCVPPLLQRRKPVPVIQAARELPELVVVVNPLVGYPL